MTLKSHHLLLCLSLCFSGGLWAQEAESAEATSSVADSLEPAYLNKSAVGVFAGAPGFGLEYAYNINKNLNLRVRGSYFSMSDYPVAYSIDGRNIDVGASADALSGDVLLEYLPFSRSSFRLVGGISYINSMGGSAVILMKDNVYFGDLELTPADVGELDIMMNYSGIAPYVAMGFGRAVPRKRVGLSVEMGTYYVGPPEIEMEATKLLTPTANEQQEQNLEEALDSFRWMPSILLKLSVRLN